MLLLLYAVIFHITILQLVDQCHQVVKQVVLCKTSNHVCPNASAHGHTH
jgi:hypothetical protein